MWQNNWQKLCSDYFSLLRNKEWCTSRTSAGSPGSFEPLFITSALQPQFSWCLKQATEESVSVAADIILLRFHHMIIIPSLHQIGSLHCFSKMLAKSSTVMFCHTASVFILQFCSSFCLLQCLVKNYLLRFNEISQLFSLPPVLWYYFTFYQKDWRHFPFMSKFKWKHSYWLWLCQGCWHIRKSYIKVKWSLIINCLCQCRSALFY